MLTSMVQSNVLWYSVVDLYCMLCCSVMQQEPVLDDTKVHTHIN